MLENLITLFQEIYIKKPKKINKRGRPKKYSDYQIALMLIIMSFKQIKSFNGITRFLKSNPELSRMINLQSIPDRATLSRRAGSINNKLREIIKGIGLHYCNNIDENILFAALDSSSMRSKGPLWHQKQRRKGIIPDKLRGVDIDSKWGFGTSKGCYQGYKVHLNVVFDKDCKLIPFPVDAVVTTANVSDYKKCRTLYWYLHRNVAVQLADKGYDDNDFFIELLTEKQILFLSNLKGSIKSNFRLNRYLLLKAFKEEGFRYLRNITVEPFNGRLKDSFHIDPLPVRGKKKVKVWVLSSIICYQLIVLFNIKTHRKMGAVKEIMELI